MASLAIPPALHAEDGAGQWNLKGPRLCRRRAPWTRESGGCDWRADRGRGEVTWGRGRWCGSAMGWCGNHAGVVELLFP